MDLVEIPFYEDYDVEIIDDSGQSPCPTDLCYCSEKYIQAWTMKLLFFFILFFII
jgi:hypothetical protein